MLKRLITVTAAVAALVGVREGDDRGRREQ